ncbi:hypothetical protein [Bacillus alkalisoli]|uniref:hypothetical protein n=1 Tax=Bacillus alkalisoli TaxID=2011008 RepID=UPI000C241FD6|nr:hypothetical protein [Bacillus alkalisoli]
MVYFYRDNGQIPQIGTAWLGTHVVTIRCSYTEDVFYSLTSSDHAPLEPASSSCAETLSRYFSIGYQLVGAYPYGGEILYVFIYR